jgi:hypothetical protein
MSCLFFSALEDWFCNLKEGEVILFYYWNNILEKPWFDVVCKYNVVEFVYLLV